MGKPFKSELASILDAYRWASTVDIKLLEEEISKIKYSPLVVIGSGGSLSACYYASALHQTKGQMAKAITPLELMHSRNIIKHSILFFLTASGKNIDIITSFKNASKDEPRKQLAMVFTKNSPLKALSNGIHTSSVFEFFNPIGKDGFLATNSLIGFFTILYRVYGNKIFNQNLDISKVFLKNLEHFVNSIKVDFTFQVLYGGAGQSVAIDIESKFSEAALGEVLYADYRNFGHGRHQWLSKRPNTCIIALVTPNDKDLAEKTLNLLPKEIPVLKLESEYEDEFAAIDLLHQSFYLVDKIGDLQNIDPGRPGVPEFGRKLYHLRYASTLKRTKNENQSIAIQRKLGDISIHTLDTNTEENWNNAFISYRKNINGKKFGCLVLDYDGTICDPKNRYTGLDLQMANDINNLLKHDIIVAIATGRGKSIRTDLKKVIDSRYHDKLIIGYYNGAEIGTVADEHVPSTKYESDKKLITLNNLLNQRYPEIKTEIKKYQLTIELSGPELSFIKNELIEFINVHSTIGLLCVESSHSIDVILKPYVSKLNVVRYCENLLELKKLSELKVLCIGDKGRFPGNDFELLSYRYSLSVDEVSRDKDSCWNLSPTGILQIDAAYYYINCFSLFDKYFQIKL